MATHSSILAWKIPWTEEPGGLQSGGCKQSDTTERLHSTLLFPVVLHLKDKKMITGKHWLRSQKTLKISLKFRESKQ